MKKVSVISGIGCTGRVAGYVNLDSFHTTHGRAIPFATGLKLANPELKVVVYSGDGDLTAIGGNHFTNDIAVGLRITTTEAERIKKAFGAALTGMVQDSEVIEITQSEQVKKILRRKLADIIQPRTEELMELIKQELLSHAGYEMASTGVVLTGGGALLEGIASMAATPATRIGRKILDFRLFRCAVFE